MNRDQMLELLDNFSIPVFQRDLPGGGTLVVAQRGARLLGMFPRREGTSGNVLWTNPNIESILSGAEKDWEGDGEGSVGGDRLWVSPERDFYYREPKTFQGWFTPLAMDPGKYHELQSNELSVTYENRCDLEDRLHGLAYKDLLLRRKFAVLANPLSASESLKDLVPAIGYVGVETEETLQVSSFDQRPMMCPWGLTQVLPPGEGKSGTVVIPTARRANPIHYFTPVPPDRLRVEDNYVAFRIDSEDIYKLAIAAEDLSASGTVRVAYLSPVPRTVPDGPRSKPGDWVLLIHESEDIARSSADAMDPSKSDPDGPRGVIQTYNNGPHGTPDYARFGEIEIQYLPLRPEAEGIWRSTVRSRLMAFQGAKNDILKIATDLLALPNIALFE